MGNVEFTNWWPQLLSVTCWEIFSISSTNVGTMVVFGGGRDLPQNRPASVIRGSEKVSEKILNKIKRTHLRYGKFEVEKCM